jgi:hypothetical protein
VIFFKRHGLFHFIKSLYQIKDTFEKLISQNSNKLTMITFDEVISLQAIGA